MENGFICGLMCNPVSGCSVWTWGEPSLFCVWSRWSWDKEGAEYSLWTPSYLVLGCDKVSVPLVCRCSIYRTCQCSSSLLLDLGWTSCSSSFSHPPSFLRSWSLLVTELHSHVQSTAVCELIMSGTPPGGWCCPCQTGMAFLSLQHLHFCSPFLSPPLNIIQKHFPPKWYL